METVFPSVWAGPFCEKWMASLWAASSIYEISANKRTWKANSSKRKRWKLLALWLAESLMISTTSSRLSRAIRNSCSCAQRRVSGDGGSCGRSSGLLKEEGSLPSSCSLLVARWKAKDGHLISTKRWESCVNCWSEPFLRWLMSSSSSLTILKWSTLIRYSWSRCWWIWLWTQRMPWLRAVNCT